MIKSKIDPTYHNYKTTWDDICKNNEQLVYSLETHNRKERYHLEMFECDESNCKIYKPIKTPREI